MLAKIGNFCDESLNSMKNFWCICLMTSVTDSMMCFVTEDHGAACHVKTWIQLSVRECSFVRF